MKSEYFCHQNSICESTTIGKGTRIWAFSHVLPGAIIGQDCNICDHVFIENRVKIGNNVTIKSGVQIWDGVIIEDHAFIGPNATFTNDMYPPNRGKTGEFEPETICICEGASIGANATILPGVIIGANAIVGAGAVVTRSVQPNTVVVGNPAKVVRTLGENGNPQFTEYSDSTSLKKDHTLGSTGDLRWHLLECTPQTVLQLPMSTELPFPIGHIKTFSPHSTQNYELPAYSRGERFLLCIRASTTLLVEDLTTSCILELTDPCAGLVIPPMTWIKFREASQDTMLMLIDSFTNKLEREQFQLTWESFSTTKHQYEIR